MRNLRDRLCRANGPLWIVADAGAEDQKLMLQQLGDMGCEIEHEVDAS